MVRDKESKLFSLDDEKSLSINQVKFVFEMFINNKIYLN